MFFTLLSFCYQISLKAFFILVATKNKKRLAGAVFSSGKLQT